MALSRIAAYRYHRLRHEPEAAKAFIGENDYEAESITPVLAS